MDIRRAGVSPHAAPSALRHEQSPPAFRSLHPVRPPNPAQTLPDDGAVTTWRVRIRRDDHPGTLARVAIRLADLECNVLGLSVLPVPGGVLDEITVRPAEGLTPALLVEAVEKGGCRCLAVTGAALHELADPAAAALNTAVSAVGDSGVVTGAVTGAVRELVAADMVTLVAGEEANPGRTEGGHRAVVPLSDGTALVLRRVWAPFAHLELARVRVLLRLREVARADLTRPAVVRCADGATLVLRQGRSDDADAVNALHSRCSTDTFARRYPVGPHTISRRWLHRLLTPGRGLSLLAVCGRDVVALGQLTPCPDGDAAEVSLLVEDDWQRNGVGTALLRRLAVLAAARGHREMFAVCPPGEDGIRRAAVRAGLRPACALDANGVLRVNM